MLRQAKQEKKKKTMLKIGLINLISYLFTNLPQNLFPNLVLTRKKLYTKCSSLPKKLTKLS